MDRRSDSERDFYERQAAEFETELQEDEQRRETDSEREFYEQNKGSDSEREFYSMNSKNKIEDPDGQALNSIKPSKPKPTL